MSNFHLRSLVKPLEGFGEGDEGMKAIKEIKPIQSDVPIKGDIILALMTACGASISSMSDEIEGQITYSDRYELFDPEKVRQHDIPNLHEPWDKVYKLHMQPNVRDCRIFRYRYVYVPKEILPEYPRVPCKGIFGLTDRKVKANQIKSKDLIFIGNEFE